MASLHIPFKNRHSFEERLAESSRIKKEHPGRIPIICERSTSIKGNAILPIIDKTKYLVPHNFTVCQFMFVIRNRLQLDHEEALYLVINNSIPPSSALLDTLYHEHKDKDGFLYVQYMKENVFGQETAADRNLGSSEVKKERNKCSSEELNDEEEGSEGNQGSPEVKKERNKCSSEELNDEEEGSEGNLGSPEKQFFVYMLSSEDRKTTYIGATVDLEHRLRQHNGEIKGGAVATTSKNTTWSRIAHVSGFPSWKAALQFEWRWKQITRKTQAKANQTPIQRRFIALKKLLQMDRPTTKAEPYSSWTSKPQISFLNDHYQDTYTTTTL